MNCHRELEEKLRACIKESGLSYREVFSAISRVRVDLMNKGTNFLNAANIQEVEKESNLPK